MKYGLQDEVVQKISGVFIRFPAVHKAVLYGSRAKGDYKNGSDVDLTLVGPLDADTLGQIMDALDDLLLPYSMGLSIFSNITDQSLLDHIKRVGVVFYES